MGVISTGTIARNFVRTAAAIPVFGAIYGTKGRIEIPEFKNPQRATLFVDGEAPLTVERPFEVNGYEYEIRESLEMIRQGKLESESMPLEDSLFIMDVMDEVRRLWNQGQD